MITYIRLLKNVPLILWVYLFCCFCLFFYSFTQVDLSLTLSKSSIAQTIQKQFQYVGYFQRPLSTALYSGIMVGLFFSYLLLFKKSITNTLLIKQLWLVIIFVTVLLVFSYNAFSYDLFNYIFDAKIVTHYQLNPYVHKALDFPGDPMLSFMRWTHRVYPYGPLWLVITVPVSFLGFQFFIPTFFLFKSIIAVCFLGTVWYIYQILKKYFPQNVLSGLVLFALNPLVITESLVSAHNDIVMMFFVIVSLYYLFEKKHFLAFALFFISVGIKFATIFLLPVFLFIWYRHLKKKQIDYDRIISIFIVSMCGAIFAASLRTQFQPWYLLYIFPFFPMVSKWQVSYVIVSILSVAGLMQYIPFLAVGNWDPPIPFILQTVTFIGFLMSLIALIIFKKKA